MRADIEGTVFSIVTCTMAPKAFGQGRSGAASDGNIKEASWSREDRTIITELYNEGAIGVHSVLVNTIFWVDSGKRGGGIG